MIMPPKDERMLDIRFGDANGNTTFVDKTGRCTITAQNGAHHDTDPSPWMDLATSLLLDGINQHLTVTDNDALEPESKNFCVEMAIKMYARAGDRSLFAKHTGSVNNRGYKYRIDEGNTTSQILAYDQNNFDTFLDQAIDEIPPNTWVHVAVQYDLDNNEIRTYIDGVIKQTITYTRGTINNGDEALHIGLETDDTDAFDGRIAMFVMSDGVKYTQDFRVGRYTEYYTSTGCVTTDSRLSISGYQVWCLEFMILQGSRTNTIIDSRDSLSGSGGLRLWVNSSNTLRFKHGVDGGSDVKTSIPLKTWIKVVIVVETDGDSTIYINNTNELHYINGTGYVAPSDGVAFGINREALNSQLHGRLRNIEIYEGGVASAAWEPGNTSSLGTPTLVFQSKNGNLEDNNLSMEFTKTGSPLLIGDKPPHLGYTDYDGSGDYYTSTDSDIMFSGAQTWCFEVRFDSVSAQQFILDSRNLSGDGGMVLYLNSGDGNLYFARGTASATNTFDPVANQWYRVVIVCGASDMKIYIDGVLENTIGSAYVIPDNKVSLGNHRSSTGYLDGRLRHLEIYSGAATNPEDWKPGNLQSLDGTTHVFNSPDGNGEANDQGVVWTKFGDPTVVP